MQLLHQTFPAVAHRPDWGAETVPGTVTLTGHCLRFHPTAPGAAGDIEIPLNRLGAVVQSGPGSDDERLALTDSDDPGLTILTPDLDLLEATGVPPLAHAREAWMEQLSRQEMRRRWRLLGIFALACVVLIAVGSAALGYMVRSVAARVPPSWDATFGEALIKEMREEQPFLNDTNAIARLADLAAPLLAVLPPSTNGHTFHIVQDPEPNAFALPGGHIVVHTGMLTLTTQPEELLGVLAHELAHVSERHVYRNIISSGGAMAVCALFLGGNGGLGDLAAGGAALMVGAGFSQEYETEADLTGWAYLVRANIDPRGMIRVFEKLKAHEEAGPGTDLTPRAFQSHPALQKRIARLERRWKSTKRQEGFLELPALPVLPALPAATDPAPAR